MAAHLLTAGLLLGCLPGGGGRPSKGILGDGAHVLPEGPAHTEAHAQAHPGAHKAGGGPLVFRGGLHNIEGVLLLVGVALPLPHPGPGGGLDVHFGGGALRLDAVLFALDFGLVDDAQVLVGDIDVVEGEVVQRQAEGVKVLDQLIADCLGKFGQVGADLQNADLLPDNLLAQQVRDIFQNFGAHEADQLLPGIVRPGSNHLLQEFAGLHLGAAGVHLFDVDAEEAVGPDVDVHIFLRVHHHNGGLGAPGELVHIGGVDKIDRAVKGGLPARQSVGDVPKGRKAAVAGLQLDFTGPHEGGELRAAAPVVLQGVARVQVVGKHRHLRRAHNQIRAVGKVLVFIFMNDNRGLLVGLRLPFDYIDGKGAQNAGVLFFLWIVTGKQCHMTPP